MKFNPNQRDQQLRELFHRRQATLISKKQKEASPVKSEHSLKQHEIKRLTDAIKKKPLQSAMNRGLIYHSHKPHMASNENADLPSSAQQDVPTYSFRQVNTASNKNIRDFNSSSGRVDGYEFCVSSASAMQQRSASNAQLQEYYQKNHKEGLQPCQEQSRDQETVSVFQITENEAQQTSQNQTHFNTPSELISAEFNQEKTQSQNTQSPQEEDPEKLLFHEEKTSNFAESTTMPHQVQPHFNLNDSRVTKSRSSSRSMNIFRRNTQDSNQSPITLKKKSKCELQNQVLHLSIVPQPSGDLERSRKRTATDPRNFKTLSDNKSGFSSDQNGPELSFHTALSQLPNGLTSDGKYVLSTGKPSELKPHSNLLSEDEQNAILSLQSNENDLTYQQKFQTKRVPSTIPSEQDLSEIRKAVKNNEDKENVCNQKKVEEAASLRMRFEQLQQFLISNNINISQNENQTEQSMLNVSIPAKKPKSQRKPLRRRKQQQPQPQLNTIQYNDPKSRTHAQQRARSQICSRLLPLSPMSGWTNTLSLPQQSSKTRSKSSSSKPLNLPAGKLMKQLQRLQQVVSPQSTLTTNTETANTMANTMAHLSKYLRRRKPPIPKFSAKRCSKSKSNRKSRKSISSHHSVEIKREDQSNQRPFYYPISALVGMDVNRRNELWQARKEKWVSDQQYEKGVRELEGCTFAPKRYTSRRARSASANRQFTHQPVPKGIYYRDVSADGNCTYKLEAMPLGELQRNLRATQCELKHVLRVREAQETKELSKKDVDTGVGSGHHWRNRVTCPRGPVFHTDKRACEKVARAHSRKSGSGSRHETSSLLQRSQFFRKKAENIRNSTRRIVTGISQSLNANPINLQYVRGSDDGNWIHRSLLQPGSVDDNLGMQRSTSFQTQQQQDQPRRTRFIKKKHSHQFEQRRTSTQLRDSITHTGSVHPSVSFHAEPVRLTEPELTETQLGPTHITNAEEQLRMTQSSQGVTDGDFNESQAQLSTQQIDMERSPLQELQFSLNHPETVKASAVIGTILAKGGHFDLTCPAEKENDAQVTPCHLPSFTTTAELSKSGKYCSLLQKLNSSRNTNKDEEACALSGQESTQPQIESPTAPQANNEQMLNQAQLQQQANTPPNEADNEMIIRTFLRSQIYSL